MKRSINDKNKLSPQQQVRSLVDNIVENDTYFPKAVHIEDIDKAVQQVFKNEFEIVSQGNKVPVHDIFSIQRFSEFMKTWENTDDTKNVKLPFITIVKEPSERGTNLGGTFNIASNPTFTLFKRHIIKNGKKTVEHYQIPQPVNIDLPYGFHFFTTKQRDINKMDELFLHNFKSSQYYIDVNGHNMPLKWENSDDRSETSDLKARRYYHKVYNVILKGYLLRESDYKKLSSIDSIKIHIEPSTVKNSRDCVVDQIDLGCDLCLSFKFNRKSENSKTVNVPANLNFYYDNQNNDNYAYFVNGQSVVLPFSVKAGDELTVAHSFDTNKVINIKVCGEKI